MFDLSGNAARSHDLVILRDKDANGGGGWTGAADGTLEERRYYCQNWRADVSVVLKSTGYFVERIKYSAYGTPFGLPAGDTDSDGDCDGADAGAFYPTSYDARFDLDLDGDNDATDYADTLALSGTTLGRGKLSRTDTGNRKGYAGYENDGNLVRFYHVRHRVLDTLLGRWTRRDPLGHVDGLNPYTYAGSRSLAASDASGLLAESPEIDFNCMDIVELSVGLEEDSLAALPFLCSCATPWTPTGKTLPSILGCSVVRPIFGGSCTLSCPNACQESCTGTQTTYIPSFRYVTFCGRRVAIPILIPITLPCTDYRRRPCAPPAPPTTFPGLPSSMPGNVGRQCCGFNPGFTPPMRVCVRY